MSSTSPSLLRPAFTRRLWQRLLAGECLRLVGSDGQGRSRILEDIQLLLPPGTGFVSADLALFYQDYASLMQGLAAAIGSDTRPEDLGEWVEAIKLHAGTWVLALDHFEAVEQPDADPRYDRAFFTTLQLLALDTRVSLLCLSDRAPVVSVADMAAFESSFDLELEMVALPPLSLRRLEEEAKRNLVSHPKWVNPVAMEAFSHPMPFTFLQFLTGQVAPLADTDPAKSMGLFVSWRKTFDALHGLDHPLKRQPAPWWRSAWARIFPPINN